jgi:hypothetical protein
MKKNEYSNSLQSKYTGFTIFSLQRKPRGLPHPLLFLLVFFKKIKKTFLKMTNGPAFRLFLKRKKFFRALIYMNNTYKREANNFIGTFLPHNQDFKKNR